MANEVSVFQCLGPTPHQDKRTRPMCKRGLDDEEDKYHRPWWCSDGLRHTEKHRVQQLQNIEEARVRYLEVLRKARPDLAVKVRYPWRAEQRPQRREWHPKQPRADEEANGEAIEEADERAEGMPSADVNMVFVLPQSFHALKPKESSVTQMDLGPQLVVFEKSLEKGYKHLKAQYLKGYITGKPLDRMMVDTGVAVNIMPYVVDRKLIVNIQVLITMMRQPIPTVDPNSFSTTPCLFIMLIAGWWEI